MPRFWINSATINRLSRCGLPISMSSAVARIGLSTRRHPSIRVTLTGYYQDLSLLAFSPKNLPSLRRALLNKVFPTKKDYQATLTQGLRVWTKRKGLPSRPNNHISDLVHHLWQQHTNHLTHHITKSTFDGAIFHWEDKHASSLRIFYPCLYFKAIETTFMNTSIFETVNQDPQTLVTSLVSSLQTS